MEQKIIIPEHTIAATTKSKKIMAFIIIPEENIIRVQILDETKYVSEQLNIDLDFDKILSNKDIDQKLINDFFKQVAALALESEPSDITGEITIKTVDNKDVIE